MKPSRYNFIWALNSARKFIVFNSLTTAMIEASKPCVKLLNQSRILYSKLSSEDKRMADDLLHGGFLINDDVDELKILKVAFDSDKYDRSSLNLNIAPTLRCNFNCIYCYEQQGTDEPSRHGRHAFMPQTIQKALINYIEHEADFLKELNISWYGGEPLLARRTISGMSRKMIDLADRHGLRYWAGMTTNGYLLSGNTSVIKELHECRISVIQISLDGPPTIHNARRMLKNNRQATFDHILQGLMLLAASHIQVMLRINVDHTNIDEVSLLLDILESNGLKDIPLHLGQISPDSTGCKAYAHHCFTSDEFNALYSKFHILLNQRGFETGRIPLYPQLSQSCRANHINSFVIDPDGDVYKCCAQIGDKSAAIANIKTLGNFRTPSEQMREVKWLAWEPFDYEECVSCKVLPLCMAGCSYRAMHKNQGIPECKQWKHHLEHFIRNMHHHATET